MTWKQLLEDAPAPTDGGESLYYILPDLAQLERGVADIGERQRLRARVALALGDRDALTRTLDPETDFSDFYPDMQPPRLDTDATIDAFLSRYGADSEKETDLLTRMIFDPVPTAGVLDALDAAAPIPAEKPAERASGLSATPEAEAEVQVERERAAASGTPAAPVADETVRDSAPSKGGEGTPSPLSLGLARIMIKNHNYAKALEIISAQSLANPEKSAYFADQIRFLRKLIVNQSYNKERD